MSSSESSIAINISGSSSSSSVASRSRRSSAIDTPPSTHCCSLQVSGHCIAALVLLVVGSGIFPLFIFDPDHSDVAMWSLPVAGALALMSIGLFMRLWLADPGWLQKGDGAKDPEYVPYDIINKRRVSRVFCAMCREYRPPRAKHCYTCNRCIAIFDHHCPYVSNCVGRNTYLEFLAFLLSVFLLSSFATAVIVYDVISTFVHEDVTAVSVDVILPVLYAIFTFSIALSIALFLGFHLWMVSRGLTTYEFIKMQRGSKIEDVERGTCLQNWRSRFCVSTNRPARQAPALSIA
eukprot:195744_1